MSRHDYSQSTVSAVSDAILNCKSTVENTVLSVGSMPYSWDTGIVNNVVTWFEVLQICDSKEELRNMFEKADSRFSGTVQDIGKADSGASGSLENGLDSLRAFREKIGVLEEYSVQSVEAAGVFENLHGLLLSIAEKYNKIDFDKELTDMTDEELNKYYDFLISIDTNSLSEKDKQRIQRYIDYIDDKYLFPMESLEKYNDIVDRYKTLYVKLHPDNPGNWKKINNNIDSIENINKVNQINRKMDSSDYAKMIGFNLIPGVGPIISSIYAINHHWENAETEWFGDPDGKWNINCQRCTMAYEMRRRGFDVKAKPRYKIQENDKLSHEPFIKWENPIIYQTGSNEKNDIESRMKVWGDGSRAEVVVLWKNGGGHTFIAEQINGKTHFIDPQNGETDCSRYFDGVIDGEVYFCRIDNLNPTKYVYDCCTEV
ncbi:MAG: toxin glutamine deamidase domain-containing protein [Ruminococcus sp.]